MDHSEHESQQPDFGTAQKKLSVYTAGLISCILLTLFSFGVVLSGKFSKGEAFVLIYVAAIIQFFVQLICFLRLNTHTPQAKNNVASFVFTGIILMSIIIGSLWIMWNLNYYMMH